MSSNGWSFRSSVIALSLSFAAGSVLADDGGSECQSLPGYSALQAALVAATAAESSGLNNQNWATIVDRDGVVCAVAFSGVNRGAQWPE